MTDPTTPLRCSAASAADAEPLAGSAPTATRWLLVEVPGPWGRDALADARMPDATRAHLQSLDLRVQLIRRYAGAATGGVRVYLADLTRSAGPPDVRTTLLPDLDAVASLDLTEVRDLVEEPVWFVCTNGSRDRCCAEIGRPVTAALAAVWPEVTWETSHLGGHRFSGTLLGLPSGLVLGRVTPETAIAACRDLAAGVVPLDLVRGRAGLPDSAQAAEVHLRRERGLRGLDDVAVVAVEGDSVVLETPGGRVRVTLARTRVERRQSCGQALVKPADELRAMDVVEIG